MTHPVQKEISSYSYWRNSRRVTVPSHSRTYHVGRSRRKRVPHVRELHQKRPLQDRIKDEKTTEPYTYRERWILNPFEWDYPAVDNALEDEMLLRKEKTRRTYNLSIKEEESYDTVAELKTDLGADGESAFIKSVEVKEKYQGKGYSNILMRSIVNWADENGIILRLKSEPFGDRTIIDPDTGYEDYVKVENTPRTVRKLSRYYKQFGFKPQGKVVTTTYGSYQYMVRRPK